MRTTLADVARVSGFSTKTVSRVVNSEGSVAESTRVRVLDTIERLGYSPNVWAQRLARGHSGQVALIIHDATPAYVMSVVSGLMDSGEGLGYGTTLHRLDVRDDAEVDHVISMAIQGEVDGFVFTNPCERSSRLITEMQRLDFPFVQLTPTERCNDCSWVAATDEAGSNEATKYLISQGHSRIGFIQGNVDHKASWDRRRGYERALIEQGIGLDNELIRQGNWTFDSGVEQGDILLRALEPPTAIMAGNDEAAAGVLKAAWRAGVRCPQHLSVVGFDDVPLARQVTPPLTTVRQPIYEIASQAMVLLAEELIPGRASGVSIEVATELVVRDSTGPCREVDGNL